MNQSIKDEALNIINLLDYTSLGEDDTDGKIKELCNKANELPTNVASICIYPNFIKLVKELTNFSVATVVNFPSGEYKEIDVLKQIESALDKNCDEIDLVLPYKALKRGNNRACESMVKNSHSLCRDSILKVIIESGKLNDDDIKRASLISLDGGAHFIKTSTGKVKINATPNAVKIMTNVIKEGGYNSGIKVSGGVKTLQDAKDYISICKEILGEGFIQAKTFRIGASSILDDLLKHI